MDRKRKSITISEEATADGTKVVARMYTDGELSYSAEAKNIPWDKYDFLQVAIDALFVMRDKIQGSPAVERQDCRLEQDDDLDFMDDNDADVPEDKVLSFLSSIREIVQYERNPEQFWNDFEKAKFVLKVNMSDWDEFAHSAIAHGFTWYSGGSLLQSSDLRGHDYVYVAHIDAILYNGDRIRGVIWDEDRDAYQSIHKEIQWELFTTSMR